MDLVHGITSIAHVIQLAVAPVFLLTGIAGFLTVLSTRLGRITDRVRILESGLNDNSVPKDQHSTQLKEIKTLWKRVSIINRAIQLCTTSAVLVCLVVVTLFIVDLSPIDLSLFIAVLFITAMLILVSGLLYFLREVGIATYTVRIGITLFDTNKDWSND